MSSADLPQEPTDAAADAGADTARSSYALGARPWFTDAQRAELAGSDASKGHLDRDFEIDGNGNVRGKFFPRGGEADMTGDTTGEGNKPKLTPIMRDHQ